MPPCSMGTFQYTVRPGDTLWMIAKRYHTTVNAIIDANPGMDLRIIYIGQVICIRPGYEYSQQIQNTSTTGISKAEADLNNLLRMLWEQHVFWTRQTIQSMIFNLPDVDVVTNRLLRNPEDFGSVLKPLYGAEATSIFVNLFKSHLVIAGELVKAAKEGDTKAAADAEKRWYSNADEIAAFLGSINPFWSEDDWKKMLYEHLALTKTEAVNILNKNYAESISTFDEIEKQALKMADTMTYGIVKQFPDKFI